MNLGSLEHECQPWRLLPHDQARLEYARLLWRRPHVRARLLRHWTDPRHPYSNRFQGDTRRHVEDLLATGPDDDCGIDRRLREQGLSLRVVVREIPPVFGSFY